MKTENMGATQSSKTRWAVASAVSRSVPNSDNYFTQLLGTWAAKNAVWSPPVEITLDDSDDADDDDVQIVKIEPAQDPSDDCQCEITFTEPPGKVKSRKKIHRDRARMSPYYRPSSVMTRNTYLEMLRKHVPSYCSGKVTFKRVHPKRILANETVTASQLKSPVSKYNIVDYATKKHRESQVVHEISDDDDDQHDHNRTSKLTYNSSSSARRGEWFESFRRELDALNEEREKENDLQEAAYEKVVKNRSSLVRKPSLPVEVPPQTPALTEEMRQKIQEALKRPNPQEVLITEFKLEITRADLDTLKGLTWLNDTIINFYLNMIVARCRKAELKLPRVYTFSTFFYTRLSKEGHKAVKRWTRRDDIFLNDILLVPVHLGMHWCLAVVDFRKKTISYYDSMGGNNGHCTSCLLRYLQDELQDKKQQTFDVTGWVCKNLKDLPQQGNGSDCGMFACKYAEYIARDARMNFTQKDMPYFRQRMIYEIIQGKLL